MQVATLGLKLDGGSFTKGLMLANASLKELTAAAAAARVATAGALGGSGAAAAFAQTKAGVTLLGERFGMLQNQMALGRVTGAQYQTQLAAMRLEAAQLAKSATLGVSSMGALVQVTREMGVAAKTTGINMGSMQAQIAAMAAAYGVFKAATFISGSVMLAARYETLGVAMDMVGRNARFTSTEMHEFQKQMEKTGISAIGAREALLMMAAAQLDLSKASDIARVAQDVAIVRNKTSAEMLETFTRGIVGGRAQILRYVGVMVDFEGGYKRYADSIGKTAGALTEGEKIQARFNEALRVGQNYAGAYTAAMGTAGKQITSTVRYMENMREKAGAAFLPAFTVMVFAYANALKWLGEHATLVSAVMQTFLAVVTVLIIRFAALKLGMASAAVWGQIWAALTIKVWSFSEAMVAASMALKVFQANLPVIGWVSLAIGVAITAFLLWRKHAADAQRAVVEGMQRSKEATDAYTVSLRKMNAAQLAAEAASLRAQRDAIRPVWEQRGRAWYNTGHAYLPGDRERVSDINARLRAIGAERVGRQPEDTSGRSGSEEIENTIRERQREAEQLRGLNALIGHNEQTVRRATVMWEWYNELRENATKASGAQLGAMNAATNAVFMQRLEADSLNAALERLNKTRDTSNKILKANVIAKERRVAEAEIEAARKERAVAVEARDREDVERGRAGVKDQAAANAAEVRNTFATMLKDMQRTLTDFFSQVLDGGVRSFRSLFDAVRKLFANLVADIAGMQLQRIMLGLIPTTSGIPGATGTGNGRAAAGLGGAMVGFGVGYGLGQGIGGVGGVAAGTMGGAASGAMVGLTLGGPVGALIGGAAGALGGLVGGLMGSAAAAKRAEAAMKAFSLSLAQFRDFARGTGTPLKDQIREVQARAEALRQQAIDAEGMKKSRAERWEINALEIQAIARLKREAVEAAGHAQEDLEVRGLRAQGRTQEADRLALQYAQEREREEAREAGRNATYLNTLATVQNTEMTALLNGTLTAAMRNIPSGFLVESYTHRYGQPRTTSSATPSTTVSITGPITLQIPPGMDPDKVGPAFVRWLDGQRNATTGIGTSRSATLERVN